VPKWHTEGAPRQHQSLTLPPPYPHRIPPVPPPYPTRGLKCAILAQFGAPEPLEGMREWASHK
jgi:hypothetical protein